MLTDLVQIRRLGEKQRGENHELRQFLRRRNYPEQTLKRIAQETEEQIDCTACANCCRVATVPIAEREVSRLAKWIGVSEREFLTEYTTRTGEGLVLRRNEHGCVFLKANLCTIYDGRPRNCQNFPHLVRGNGSLASRMWQMVDRACYCPIVYNTLEEWKRELGFRAAKPRS